MKVRQAVARIHQPGPGMRPEEALRVFGKEVVDEVREDREHKRLVAKYLDQEVKIQQEGAGRSRAGSGSLPLL